MFSLRVVGWAMDERITQQLTLNALRMAIATRRPLPGLLHHSDRGSQGGFKRSLQLGLGLCWPIVAIGQAPLRVFSKPVSFEVSS